MSLKYIKGQQTAVKLLKKAIENNRLATTYLFYGPKGVGKQSTALEFVKTLNCSKSKPDSCDECSSCLRIKENKHPDVMFVYPVGKKRVIKMEQVRQLQKFISMKAYEGRIKVCIIQDAHTLQVESSNALLKTLEEPSSNSVLILVTHSPDSLLPTITSRSQNIQFFYLKQNVIFDLLKDKMGFSDKEADYYSKLSMGSMETALNLKNENVINQRKFILDIFADDSAKGIKEVMERVSEIQEFLDKFKEDLAAQLGNEEDAETSSQDEDAFIAGEYRKQVEDMLGLIMSWYRDILVYKNTHKEDILINKDYIDRIKYWDNKLDTDKLCYNIDVINDIKEGLARQINLKLLLQVMFVQLGLV